LDSWLASLYPDGIWKWIYHLSCWQQTTPSHENQRICCFTRSGGFLSWAERGSVSFRLQDGKLVQFTTRLVILGSRDTVALLLRVRDKPV